jgi:hypothetical protein
MLGRLRSLFVQLSLVLGIVVLSLLATACDATCHLTIENHTGKAVTVSGARGYDSDLILEPCSVLVRWPAGCFGSKSFSVTAKDEYGNVVFEEDVPKVGQSSRRPARVHIVIPGEQGACPEAVRDRYQLQVRNEVNVQVAVSINNEVLGTVDAFGDKTFGPLVGNWYDVGIISAASTEGVQALRLDRTFPEAYKLGQIPSIQVEVHE